MEKAIHHLEIALGIVASVGIVEQLFWINLALARVFPEQGKFKDAQTHLECTKSHVADNTYF